MLVERYELDSLDLQIVEKVRTAIAYDSEGDPIDDAIDEAEMIDAMRLLLEIVDAGCAA